MRILLADDSSLILERLNYMVHCYKHAEIVAELKNGKDALEALRILKPDMAIMDIKMPGLSGLYVLNEIRKENSSIIIIILTLYSSNYYRQLAIQFGTNYFFSKSDDFEKVSFIVAQYLEKEEKFKQIKPI